MHEPCLLYALFKMIFAKNNLFRDPDIIEHKILNGNIVDFIVLTHILRELKILIFFFLPVREGTKSASAPNPLIPQ